MQLWTMEHIVTVLPALAAMLALSAVLKNALGKKSHKIRMIPLQLIACALLALEAGKQIISLSRGYDLYHLPFHYCSLFIFMLPLMAFYRGKHQEAVASITSALCAAVTAMMLIYPNLIYSAQDIRGFFTEYVRFHTVLFHNLVMLAFLLILSLDLHTPDPRRETRHVLRFMLAFSLVAAVMAQLLKTNYANFYSCNIPALASVVDAVRIRLGAVLTQLLYVLAVTAVQTLFTLCAFRTYALVHAGIRTPYRRKQTVRY